MLFSSLRIGDLIAKVPIIQGGMGIGVSLSKLAGAVAKAGGIGVVSAAQPGFKDPDFKRHTYDANIRALSYHIEKAKEISDNGIIGVNIMCRGQHYEDYVKCAVQSGADIIFSGAGLPKNLPESVKGKNTKIAPIIGSSKAAAVLLKLWERHHNRTADLVVIEGPKAGGHLGYSREDIAIYEHKSYDEEIIKILEIVKTFENKFNKKIPVVFGGGIFDKSDINHCISLGLSGVQMATRFVATEECDASREFKEAYIKAKKEDIGLVHSPVHMPGRAIINPYVKKILRGKEIVSSCFRCLTGCSPQTTPYCITMALVRSVTGDVDNGLIFCGANAWKIKEITTVPKLISGLTE